MQGGGGWGQGGPHRPQGGQQYGNFNAVPPPSAPARPAYPAGYAAPQPGTPGYEAYMQYVWTQYYQQQAANAAAASAMGTTTTSPAANVYRGSAMPSAMPAAYGAGYNTVPPPNRPAAYGAGATLSARPVSYAAATRGPVQLTPVASATGAAATQRKTPWGTWTVESTAVKPAVPTADPGAFPPALLEYTRRAMQLAKTDAERKQAETLISQTIVEATREGVLRTRDWSKYPLPSLTSPEKIAFKLPTKNIAKKRPTFGDDMTSTSTSSPSTSRLVPVTAATAAPLKDTPQNGGKNKDKNRSKKSVLKSLISDASLSGDRSEQREKRLRRFESSSSGSHVTTTRDDDVDDWADTGLVGTCTRLEKRYFRLTAAPNPADVRPLTVLKETLLLLEQKWRTEKDYFYICDQFKSLRQDLSVQHIRNDFTALVYESHARIALEKGDIGEFNQCQTQLRELYLQGIPGSQSEFLAYRILYFLMSRSASDLNNALAILTHIERCQPEVQHALKVRHASVTGNYIRWFQLYSSAPHMGKYLMGHFAQRERLVAMRAICKSFRPSIEVETVRAWLGFEREKVEEFLGEIGVTYVEKNRKVIDTKASMQAVVNAAHSANARVDIKGQL